MTAIENEKNLFTMCWFGFYQPYATSIVHVTKHIISPNEIDEKDLIFIWDKYMKSDLLMDLLKNPVPWSPALLEGYKREWIKKKDGLFVPNLIKDIKGKCLGAVLLLSRISEDKLQPLINDYKNRGYFLKETSILIGDLVREIRAFLP